MKNAARRAPATSSAAGTMCAASCRRSTSTFCPASRTCACARSRSASRSLEMVGMAMATSVLSRLCPRSCASGATRALHVVPPPGFEPPISLRAARPAAAATIALTPRARLRARAAARWRRASTSGRGGAGRGPANRGSASRNPPPELFLLLLLSSSSPPLHGVERPNGPPGVALPKPELCRDDELKGSERRDPSTRPVHCPAESDGRDSS